MTDQQLIDAMKRSIHEHVPSARLRSWLVRGGSVEVRYGVDSDAGWLSKYEFTELEAWRKAHRSLDGSETP